MRKHLLVIAFVASVVGLAACSGDEDASAAMARRDGRVKIVYDDAGIKPENRDAVKFVRDSGAFERFADRTSRAVALPHDIEVRVSDNIPKGIDNPTTEPDGRTIYWPADFFTATRTLLAEAVADINRDKGRPKAIASENFNADVLTVWASEFILGHEIGHDLIHQLRLPLTGLEEDSADGFATFFTVNDKERGPNAALGAAILFDQMARKQGTVTLEDLSSDHAVVQQRVYNFLCSVVGSDPQRLGSSLVTDGYVPQSRALLCRKEWTQLNYGWWTILEPHLTDAYKAETATARRQARKDLDEENAALLAKLRQMRGQPP
jgi:Putative metallopeptidase